MLNVLSRNSFFGIFCLCRITEHSYLLKTIELFLVRKPTLFFYSPKYFELQKACLHLSLYCMCYKKPRKSGAEFFSEVTSGLHEVCLSFYFSQQSSMTWSLAELPMQIVLPTGDCQLSTTALRGLFKVFFHVQRFRESSSLQWSIKWTCTFERASWEWLKLGNIQSQQVPGLILLLFPPLNILFPLEMHHSMDVRVFLFWQVAVIQLYWV